MVIDEHSWSQLVVSCIVSNTSQLFYFNALYRASFVILHYDKPMHNYFTNYHTPTYFATIVSSSDSF